MANNITTRLDPVKVLSDVIVKKNLTVNKDVVIEGNLTTKGINTIESVDNIVTKGALTVINSENNELKATLMGTVIRSGKVGSVTTQLTNCGVNEWNGAELKWMVLEIGSTIGNTTDSQDPQEAGYYYGHDGKASKLQIDCDEITYCASTSDGSILNSFPNIEQGNIITIPADCRSIQINIVNYRGAVLYTYVDYAIVYDPANESVRLGCGKYDEVANEFNFYEGEGYPIAVRDFKVEDDGCLVAWDADNNCFNRFKMPDAPNMEENPVVYWDYKDNEFKTSTLRVQGTDVLLNDDKVVTESVLEAEVDKLNTKIDETREDLEDAIEEVDSKISIVSSEADSSGVLKGEYKGYKNTAISSVSLALGAASTSGLKGWYYSGIDFTNKKIYLSRTQPNSIKTSNFTTDTSITIDDIQGPKEGLLNRSKHYQVGHKISIVCDSKFENCSTIENVSAGVITVDTIPFTAANMPSFILGAGKQPDDFTLYSIVPEIDGLTKELKVYGYCQGDIDLGGGSLAEGVNTFSVNIGSHTEGIQTVGYGQYSHAEGFKTQAGYNGHAEGKETKAIGETSHAEGLRNEARGKFSHVEGEGNIANGSSTHIEGYNNVANGNNSHAGGKYTRTEGNSSQAVGIGVTATKDAQTVVGVYNATDNDALFIVGAGDGPKTDTEKNNNKPVVPVNAFTAGRTDIDGSYITVGDTKVTETQLANSLAGQGSASSAASVNYDQTIKSVAHRGYSAGAPENTLAAVILAKEKGFNYVECDVGFTKDNVPVLLHDQTIDRTSNGTGKISNLNYAEVKDLDFGSWFSPRYNGEKIPTFEEFLATCKKLGLYAYVEFSENTSDPGTINGQAYTAEQIKQVIKLVEDYGMQDNVCYISFNLDNLVYAHEADADARIGYCRRYEITDTDVTNIKNLRNTNEVFIQAKFAVVSDEGVNKLTNDNIPLEVWTVNTVDDLLKLNSYASGITTDRLIAGKILSEVTQNEGKQGYFNVTRVLVGCYSENTQVLVKDKSSYIENIIPEYGYSISNATVSVTMGGVDITPTYKNGRIDIAEVTGDIVINIEATALNPVVNIDLFNSSTTTLTNTGSGGVTYNASITCVGSSSSYSCDSTGLHLYNNSYARVPYGFSSSKAFTIVIRGKLAQKNNQVYQRLFRTSSDAPSVYYWDHEKNDASVVKNYLGIKLMGADGGSTLVSHSNFTQTIGTQNSIYTLTDKFNSFAEHTYILTCDKTTITLYIDGILCGTQKAAGLVTSTHIGLGNNDADAASKPYYGAETTFTEFKIFDTCLTSEDIQGLIKDTYSPSNVINTSTGQTVFGKYNETEPTASLIVGVGSATDRQNAFAAGNDGTHDYITVGETKVTEVAFKQLLGGSSGLPPYDPVADEGAILRIVNGYPTWVKLTNAEDLQF